MRYHLRERAWSITEDFLVRDDRGQAIFEVRGRFFHIGDNLVLLDRSSGQNLVEIKQRLISLLPSYDIYRQGQHWANVHEQLHLFGGERFKVEGENGQVFHIQGNLWDWSFTITDNAGNLWATVGRQFSLFRDSYAVDVVSGVDAPFIIALAVVIELVKEHHEEHRA
ncbi:UDP-N-acetylenolpyruvoylglucosamine reductase [Ktedonobacteria bacterium brp13]|nr:UDP-N-acetylenolpyruvoylglucosamine reductase [Ktedonobacteria bacterium brp13]